MIPTDTFFEGLKPTSNFILGSPHSVTAEPNFGRTKGSGSAKNIRLLIEIPEVNGGEFRWKSSKQDGRLSSHVSANRFNKKHHSSVKIPPFWGLHKKNTSFWMISHIFPALAPAAVESPRFLPSRQLLLNLG